ncbi:MAG: hypothetical protein EZS28_025433 [Streblomastix strix]|uniref:DDE-1 domain-containing protein n=1 Tax=Streblomastix strix TaxID=222440 RepID=A0A5J4V987_9EUKA|nr:MAG: hypothetical protein EZS28_025433 [Streblomastix strix]
MFTGWRIEKLLYRWEPELDKSVCAADLATFQRKSLSQLEGDTVTFMKNLKFHLLSNTIFCEICQCSKSIFSRLTKEQLMKKMELGRQSRMLTDELENELIMYLTMEWLESQTFQLANMGRVRHADEIEIVRISPREYRHMKLQCESVQTYICILKGNIHGVLAVLISNADKSSVEAFSEGGVKHFLVSTSIAHDVSSYGVDRAEAVVCSSGTGNLSSDLFVRWLKESYFPDFDGNRVAIKQRNTLTIQLTDNCGIHTTDEVKQLLGQRNVKMISFPANITQFFQPLDYPFLFRSKESNYLISWVKTKPILSQDVPDAFDVIQKPTSFKVTQAAFRIAEINFDVVRGTIVAKICVQKFDIKINKLTADKIMTSGSRTAPQRKRKTDSNCFVKCSETMKSYWKLNEPLNAKYQNIAYYRGISLGIALLQFVQMKYTTPATKNPIAKINRLR